MSRCIKPELRPQKDHFKVSTTFQLPFIRFLEGGRDVQMKNKIEATLARAQIVESIPPNRLEPFSVVFTVDEKRGCRGLLVLFDESSTDISWIEFRDYRFIRAETSLFLSLFDGRDFLISTRFVS